MMRVLRACVCGFAAALVASAAMGVTPPKKPRPPSLFGVWQNPSASVHIKTAKCGASVCGTVVYANEKAKADAARGGTANLLGLNLFQSFAQQSQGVWEGKVLVPDLDRTVTGKITLIDAKSMNVEGCMFGHIACKDQVWTRVK